MSGDQSFPKEHRLRTPPQFAAVYRRRCSASDGVLVVHALRNDLGFSRLGLTVSRKVGNAVVRNRWKRRIREAFRTGRPELPPGLDLVVAPRRGADPDFTSIRDSLSNLAKRVDQKLG